MGAEQEMEVNKVKAQEHPILSTLLPPTFIFHPLRIASQTNMTTIIQVALTHLQDPTSSPLVLHSFKPAPLKKSTFPLQSTSTPINTINATSILPPSLAVPSIPSSTKKLSPSALPKLISITEILKRSYLPPHSSIKGKEKELDVEVDAEVDAEVEGEDTGEMMEGVLEGASVEKKTKQQRGRKRKKIGIHQYTLLGALEELGMNQDGEDDDAASGSDEENEEKRQQEVVKAWLEGGAKGTKRPRRKHTPYMLVVLSPQPLPELMRTKRFTYQAPLPRPPAPRVIPVRKTDAAAEAGGVESGDSKVRNEGNPPKKKRKRSNKKKLATKLNASKEGGTVV